MHGRSLVTHIPHIFTNPLFASRTPCPPPVCFSANEIRALEAIVSGRADGSAGPTVGSFCTALVKTGGSSVLIYAFFHGLKQMSSSDVTTSQEGLPVTD